MTSKDAPLPSVGICPHSAQQHKVWSMREGVYRLICGDCLDRITRELRDDLKTAEKA